MTYGNSSSITGTYFGYENMGRVKEQRQVTGSNTYSLSYTYNLAGLLATERYPSNRLLTHSYDNAGRLSELSDGTTTFASSFSYAASGGMLSETWGNGAVHSVAYNNALQVSQIKLKQSSSGAELQRYDYIYGQVTQSNGSVDKSKNNGQIGRVDGIINGAGTKEWEQRFSYDELGRLSTAAEYQQGTGSAPTWQQQFTYDRYGNRFQSGSSNTVIPAYTTVVSSDIDENTNRFITSGSTPVTYDNAGNILQDAKFRWLNYTYDANNRQLSVAAMTSDLSQTSVYDAVGQRVQTTSNGVTRTMVYDIFGQAVADYSGTTIERENIYRGGELLSVYEVASTCYMTFADFITSFFQGALNRNPTSNELAEWTGKLTQGQAQGNSKLIKVAQDLGTAVFNSTEYINLATNNSVYVTDLYESFLQRAPDSGGFDTWIAALSSSSRTTVRNGFAYSLEFQGNVVRLCPTTSSGTSTSANLKYVLNDSQGSTRALMDNSGSGTSTIISRHDYLPFGEEIWSGVGLRTTTKKYGSTNKVRQRFALTEHDEATGLDHTWFRKYDSFAGRWTSPDPYSGSMVIANPQSFNRYSYVSNDPVNLIDPTGLFCVVFEHWNERTATLTVRTECYLENGGGGGGGFINPIGGGDIGGGGGGGGGGPVGETGPGQGQQGQQGQERQDCHEFANEVERIAKEIFENNSNPSTNSFPHNVNAFMDRLAQRFTEVGSATAWGIALAARRAEEHGFNASAEFGTEGFKDNFIDREQGSDNQARHAVFGLIMGYSGIPSPLNRANSRENPNTVGGRADIALNNVTVPHGQAIVGGWNGQSGELTARGLADWIRQNLCR